MKTIYLAAAMASALSLSAPASKMQAWPLNLPTTRCLCFSETQSHCVPAFAVRYVKDSDITPLMRRVPSADTRVH